MNKLWGGAFLGKGYYTNSVGQHGTANMIANYEKPWQTNRIYTIKGRGKRLRLF
jgi:hypothetical protein